MTAETLLSRLEKVRRIGPGRWQACCPSHNDKSPSLAVTELDDGRVLMKCFAGCGASEILGAVGLEFDALFPPKPLDPLKPAKPIKNPFPATDVLRAIQNEALIASVAAANLAHGEKLSMADRERLMLASQRIQAAYMRIEA